MKARIYLRVAKAKSGFKSSVSLKPNFEPISSGSGYTKKWYPTVMMALELDIPDSEFNASRILLEAKIKDAKPCVELRQVTESEDLKDGKN